MSEHLQESAGWFQWAIGGVAAGGAFVAGWLYSAIQGVRKDSHEALSELAEKVDEHERADASFHLEQADKFATKDDIERLERLIAESERRIINAIANRGPARGGGNRG